MPRIFWAFYGTCFGLMLGVSSKAPQLQRVATSILHYGSLIVGVGVVCYVLLQKLKESRKSAFADEVTAELKGKYAEWQQDEQKKLDAKKRKLQEIERILAEAMSLHRQEKKTLQEATHQVHAFCKRAAEMIGKNSSKIVKDLAKRNPSVAARRDKQNKKLARFFEDASEEDHFDKFRRHERAEKERV